MIGTANSTIAFRCGATDARLISDELDLEQPRRVKNLPNYHALVRTVENGFPGDTQQIRTKPPLPTGTRLAAVQRRTRARYARPRAMVEGEIQRFQGI